MKTDGYIIPEDDDIIDDLEGIGSLYEESIAELRHACFEAIYLHPGITQREWTDLLMLQYECEVSDALGTDPTYAQDELDRWWEEEAFQFPETSLSHTFKEWAEILATPEDVAYFDIVRQTEKQ